MIKEVLTISACFFVSIAQASAAYAESEGIMTVKTRKRPFTEDDAGGMQKRKLQRKDLLEQIFYDPTRNYMKVLTHLYAGEFNELSDRLRGFIEQSRNLSPHKTTTHVDYKHRLYYALRWLSSGESFRAMEFFTGWSKSSHHRDLYHVLKCIIRGLDDEVFWPDEEERETLANQSKGVFKDVIGIIDCTEHRIRRPKDFVLQRIRYSGRMKYHSLKTLLVVDSHGFIRYCRSGAEGYMNDRDFFNNTDLYLCRGKYFSGNQRITGDGIFRGDGPILVCDTAGLPTYLRRRYKKGFSCFRVQVEHAFKRMQQWFPVLGKRRWDYEKKLLQLSIFAVIRLHNWLLRKRRTY